MIASLFEYAFLRNAVIASILASIACGIIGTIIMEKKLVMMSGGIAHASFGGIGLGYYLGVEPLFGALVFAVTAGLGIAAINKKARTNTDLLTGIFWSAGMASGIVFISLTPGYPPDMTSYLFGDILTVSSRNLLMIITLDIVIIFTVIAFYNQFKAYMFDREFASVIGIKTTFLEYTLFILTAFTVVILIRVAGIILVIALLTAPPATAKLLTFNLKKIMIYSIILGMIYCITGLWISYLLNIASGAAIVLVAGLFYVITALAGKTIHASLTNNKNSNTK